MNRKPKILLVQPTTVHLDGTPHKTRWRLIMGLMIPLMGGLTPDEYDVTLCDERLEDINFDGGWDLVGMTTTIGASLRAYQLGDEFRRRGVPVVFGGFHATLQTEEALKHCDSVVQGEADLVWPERDGSPRAARFGPSSRKTWAGDERGPSRTPQQVSLRDPYGRTHRPRASSDPSLAA